MAKTPRYLPPEPSCLVEVSNRTVGSRFLLKPTKRAKELIAGVLARAADRYRAQVVFYVFLSSHFHLLLLVDDAEQMADFMEYVDSNIARELGRLYDWRQKFWSGPYSHVAVSEEPAAQIARLKYLASNSVKEVGLFTNPLRFSSLRISMDVSLIQSSESYLEGSRSNHDPPSVPTLS